MRPLHLCPPLSLLMLCCAHVWLCHCARPLLPMHGAPAPGPRAVLTEPHLQRVGHRRCLLERGDMLPCDEHMCHQAGRGPFYNNQRQQQDIPSRAAEACTCKPRLSRSPSARCCAAVVAFVAKSSCVLCKEKEGHKPLRTQAVEDTSCASRTRVCDDPKAVEILTFIRWAPQALFTAIKTHISSATLSTKRYYFAEATARLQKRWQAVTTGGLFGACTALDSSCCQPTACCCWQCADLGAVSENKAYLHTVVMLFPAFPPPQCTQHPPHPSATAHVKLPVHVCHHHRKA